MSLSVRRVAADELSAFRHTFSFAIGFEIQDEDFENLQRVLEPARAFAAFDDATMVGTTGGFSLDLSVPGTTMKTAGTTLVGVMPTHRRRGALTRLMAAHFGDAAAHGEPLAALWASEGSIYGRFGYGPAVYQNDVEIVRHRAKLAPALVPSGTVRVVELEEAARLLPAVYQRVRARTPGMLARSDTWWSARRLYDPRHRRGGASALRCAIYEEGGVAHGTLLYRRTSQLTRGYNDDKLLIVELAAATPAARVALWSYALSVDLIHTVAAWNLSFDEALPWLLTDPRAVSQNLRDSLWIRVLDVAAALAGRRYAAAGRLVLDVNDPLIPGNQRRFILEGGPDGATCKTTDASPDITLGIAELGAVFLGGHSLFAMAEIGRVAGTPEALARADAMFRWHVPPWCPEIF